MTNFNGPLSPSELVLLSGKEFASTAFFGRNITLFDDHSEVSLKELSTQILVVSILSNKIVGSFDLEIKEEKGLFGTKQGKLKITNRDRNYKWPSRSLEQAFLDSPFDEAGSILYNWLRTDTYNPRESIIEKMKNGLLRKKFLKVVKKKWLKFFSKDVYELENETTSLIVEEKNKRIKDMLSEYKKNYPNEFRLLNAQLSSAIKKRTKTDESSNFGGDYGGDGGDGGDGGG